jgi:ribosomal protein L37AE/L43A
MRIRKITTQNRRDFTAIYKCEHCDYSREGSGYDDDNFHRNVIPKMKCPKCGKQAAEDYRPMGTKYAADEEV